MTTAHWTIENNQFRRVPGNRLSPEDMQVISERIERKFTPPREVFYCAICENTVEANGAKCPDCIERIAAKRAAPESKADKKLWLAVAVLTGAAVVALVMWLAPKNEVKRPADETIGWTRYKLDQWIALGVVPRGSQQIVRRIDKDGTCRERLTRPFWTQRQVRAIPSQIYAFENPTPAPTAPTTTGVKYRPLSKKMLAKIRQSAGLPSRVDL